MTIYIVAIVIMIATKLCLYKDTTKNKKIFCCISGMLLFLIMAFRDPTLGNSDTVGLYIPRFLKIINLDFSGTIRLIQFYQDSDLIFYLVTKVITFITKDVSVYFAICSIPLIFFTSRFIFKYSKMPLISFLMFFALNYYPWSFIIIRHSIALGIIIYSYDFIKEKKPVKFIITVLIAACFHLSALFFLIAYPARKIKINNKKFIIAIIILGITLVFKDTLLKIIFSRLISGHYALYSGRESEFSIGGYLVVYAIIYISYILDRKRKENEQSKMYAITWIGVIITGLAFALFECFRIGMFFTIPEIILLPNAIATIEDRKTKRLITFGLIIVFSLYAINCFNKLNLIPYQFVK